MAVSPALGIDERFERRRRRRQDHRKTRDIAVDDGQVAGMIGTSILLLVGALMLLIDDDEARPRPWQEQRRPCTHDNAGLARGDRPPHPLALPRPDARMPLRRLGAEAVLDPSEE